MKTFIGACIAGIIIAVIGWGVLSSFQTPVAQAFKTQYVRLGT